ncbi:subtilisin-like protease [Dorcoceras hygrometricum]|uniref:Subtilisin-like protease n=1 Tax=Dorcoceras hygrometricum TaxID=472368 RepID=A0A2Z7CSY9_9LAMI|nr:subtilisin-like protease [Dorcoceras hygrometricum]
MELAAGLAMETSKVKTVVRNELQDTSRDLQWIQSQASLLLYIQSTWYPDARKAKVAKLDIQTQATAHPVVSYNEPAVAMHPGAKYPVDKEFSRSAKQ